MFIKKKNKAIKSKITEQCGSKLEIFGHWLGGDIEKVRSWQSITTSMILGVLSKIKWGDQQKIVEVDT